MAEEPYKKYVMENLQRLEKDMSNLQYSLVSLDIRIPDFLENHNEDDLISISQMVNIFKCTLSQLEADSDAIISVINDLSELI